MRRNSRTFGSLIARVAVGAVAALAVSCARATVPAKPQAIRLLLPSPAAPGTAYAALATELDRTVPGVHVTLQPEAGSVVVVSDVQSGEGEIGLAQADVVYLAYRRGTETHKYPHQNLRGLAVGGLNRLYVYVRRDSKIQSIAELRGKRVAIAPVGTAGELLTRMVLVAHGLQYNDVEMKVHQIRDMGRYFDSEQIDAMVIVGAVNPETITTPIDPSNLRLLPVSRDVVNRLRSEYPFVKPTVIRWRQLGDDVADDVQSIATDTLLICRKDLPEDLVYRLTKEIVRLGPVLNAFTVDADMAAATPIPLHPGAARFYRELQLLK
jgi:TRAP transporter TAXI family solute receptor